MNINIYKSIFCKFSFGLIVSFVVFFVFSHPASADYYDYIPGVGEVKVEWVGVVNGVPTVNIKDESGNIIASGAKVTINEEGRGVPDLNDLMAKSNNIITTAIEPPTHGQISDAFGNPIIDESVRYYEQFGATNPNVLQEVLFGYVDNPANPIYGLQTGASPREVVTVVLRNEGIITDPDMSWDAAKNLLISAGIEVSDRNLTISDINQILSALNLPTTLNIEDNNGDGIIQREELFNSVFNSVTHNVCSGNLCVSVAGAGVDECSSNAQCAPPPTVYNCQRCSTVYNYTSAIFQSNSSDCSNPFNVNYTCDPSCGIAAGNQTYDSCTAALPAAPSNAAASISSCSQINLTWKDNSSNESGFKIERKTGASGTWAQIGAVGSDITAYGNSGLTGNTTYYYRVRAYNSFGDSGYSNETNGTTPACPIVDIKGRKDASQSFSDGPITIDLGKDIELQWSSTGVDTCTASGGWSGSKPTSGSETISNLTKSSIYGITCSGVSGSSFDSLNVNISFKPWWREIIPW